MNEKELGEALNAIYDMEKERYQTMRLNNELYAKTRRLAIPKYITQPPAYSTKIAPGMLFMKLFGGLGLVLGVVIYFKIIDAMDEPNLPAGLILLLVFGIGILWGGLFLCGSGFIGYKIDCALCDSAERKEREAWEAKNAPRFEAYRRAVIEDQNRVEREKQLVNRLEAERMSLRDLEEEESDTLAELYEKAGIGADYRKLIPMRYMANFFNLGVSRKLEGTDGLYYLVRQELRADQFNASLQEISAKMDTIISKQSEIYNELQAIERQNSEIIREMDNGFAGVSSSISSSAAGTQKSIESSVSRYVSSCVDRQNSYMMLASHWGW